VHLRESVREEIRDLLVEKGFVVRYFDDHPFGIGVYTFAETLAADAVVGITLQLDEITSVTFVRHDATRNMRLHPLVEKLGYCILVSLWITRPFTMLMGLWRILVNCLFGTIQGVIRNMF
jgi:hypothetical protein